jgi:hypothetical protein
VIIANQNVIFCFGDLQKWEFWVAEKVGVDVTYSAVPVQGRFVNTEAAWKIE